MKPSRDLLKIRRHLAKVPVKPTVEDELASALEWALKTMEGDSGTGATYWDTIPEYRQALTNLTRYRTSKNK